MSRSGYNDYYDSDESAPPEFWRMAVARATHGKRGQTFLREMLEAFDAMEAKRLISGEIVKGGEVCAIGSVVAKRGADVSQIDPEDPESRYPLARMFNIAPSLAAEIMYMNDECVRNETPEQRYSRMREWLVEQIQQP